MADGSIVIDTRIDSSGAEKGVSKLNSIAGKSVKVFTGAVAATGTVLSGLGAYAIKVGSNFEEGMSKVSAISGATGEDLKKLTEKAKEMGAKTKFSATESAEAMQYMAIAGWKTGDMLNGIDGIMNLAAASGEDLALVSDIVTDALTAFGMSAKDSAQFADLLASAASNSNTNVSMLGESFKYVAPVAGALGHSAKDTAFALGLMANAGIKSSQSGTALRASLTNLAHPSKNMAAEMERLGISLTDSNGKVKEGKALYDELRQKFSGLTDAQKTSSAATIFGKEAMSGMLAIINASDADYKKLYENLSNCDGAAENMANTMNDNLKGQITLLSSALESLGIELYEGVNNPMKEVVKTANEMVQQLTTAFKEGGLTSLVTELGNVFATIITNIAAQLPQMINLSVQVIQSFITGIQNNLPLIATSAIQIIQTLITGFITVFPQIIQLGLQLIIQLGTGIAQAIPTLLPQIINVVIGIADMIISNIGTIIEVGIKILMALVQGLVQALPQLIQEVPRIINEFSGAIFAQLPTIVVAGVKIILMLIKGLIQSIPTLIANIPQIIMAIFNALTLFNWASAGRNLIKKVGSGIESMGPNIGNIARGVAQGVNNVLKNIFTGGLNIGRSLMTNLGSGIRSLAGSIAGTAKSIGSSVVNAIKNAFAVAPSIGKNLIQGIWNGIKSMGNWIMGLIGDFASGIIAGIKEKFKIHSPSRVMRDEVGVMLAKGIGVGVDIETPKVTKDIVDNMDDITAKMQAAVYQEQARTSRAMTAGVNKTINNTTETVTHNENGLTLKVDKFINNTKQDIKDIAEELEFYRKRNSLATGGV
ncbi:phage tail tape measure protein [Clostridium sporogenes]|uniref:phage tail tape measure protein n=3 Tax=Clostridium sporogenes TaxID=1509 RepID=UPI0013C544E6|nr:phage tail tape measure protein [Clostridium sporogenes]NFQ34647.1 phage tail tape measure protein [Clostridium sporogenes]NFQ62191.1 phage tail tape measure protein [Clostridium sporogenes]NFU09231.1 phage tail tape measure protein [Clostridium sporogenes]NFU44212.1 phage tail tape measure protein [Clostridium sporogenes]NFU63270.1 phage tail tape measure protein [Clostridium sporogenes]